MSIDSIRRYCVSMPHVTESVLWGDNLVFKVGGKMFGIVALEPARVCLSFKCSPDDFAELTERSGIIPAPYIARYSWVALESEDALSRAELESFIGKSYAMVFSKLPKNVLAKLNLR